MPIKRVLTIIIPLTFVILSIFSGLFYLSLNRYQITINKVSAVSTISKHIFQKRLIADDYLLHQSERSKIQWYLQQTKVTNLINSYRSEFQASQEKEYFDSILTDLTQSREYFDQLVSSYEQPDRNNQTEKRARLASQLTVAAQNIIVASSQLEELNQRSATRVLNRIIWLFLIAGLTLFILLLASFRVIWRSATTLARRKAQDSAILSSIGDGVFAIDTNNRIVLFNQAAQQLSGYSASEVLGRPYKSILHFYNEKDGTDASGFITTAQTGTHSAMATHTALRRKDGSSIPVADSAAPIASEGKASGVVVVFRDTTRERELEQLKDEFVSIASHELRTPLGAILAFASMVLAGDYGKVSKNLLEPMTDIKTSALRLVDLVNDLLDVARIEAGRMKFTLAELDMSTITREVSTSLQPLGKDKAIVITSSVKNVPLVQADNARVRQVLTNLIGNALKFTDKGSIVISAQAIGTRLEINVTDTGVGIAEDDKQALFAKFQQISSAQKGRPIGTGLGLYICREMVRKMGGELWIKNTAPHKGSTFSFTLPQAGSPTARRIKTFIKKESQLHPDQK